MYQLFERHVRGAANVYQIILHPVVLTFDSGKILRTIHGPVRDGDMGAQVLV